MATPVKSFFIQSQDIQVYPSGFRAEGYIQSKLTTEQNITQLQNFTVLDDGVYSDILTSNHYLFRMKGYTFYESALRLSSCSAAISATC